MNSASQVSGANVKMTRPVPSFIFAKITGLRSQAVPLAIAVMSVAVFVAANMIPIRWTSTELIDHGYNWSLSLPGATSFHLGLRAEDWKKPFLSADVSVDGSFRTRQASYFLEMLSFKFWQAFGHAFFRNYSLIIVHLVNVLLLGILLYDLLGNLWAALGGAVFFLNSGIALSTLLYPFRNAKVVVVTFFLLAGILICRSARPLVTSRTVSWVSFFVLMVLGLLTDELFFILGLSLLVYLAWRDGIRTLSSPRFVVSSLITVLALTGAVYAAWHANRVILPQGGFSAQKEALATVLTLFRWPQAGWDILQSFFGCFLPNNFGFWSLSWRGALALLVALLLVSCLRLPTGRPGKIAMGCAVLLGVLTCLVPHNGGIHEGIMPETAVFPSLLFFSFYYCYPHAMLLALIFGCAIPGQKDEGQHRITLILGLLFVLALLSYLHLRNGPQDALRFHGWDRADHQQLAVNVQKAHAVIGRAPHQPVYLSFPYQGLGVHENRWSFNSAIVPLQYLPDIASGRAIVSSFGTKADPEDGRELSRADRLYDVVMGEEFDFGRLSAADRKSLENPIFVAPAASATFTINHLQDKATIVFFIREPASFEAKIGQASGTGTQYYGPCYQMFRIELKDMAPGSKFELVVYPATSKGALIIGPFVVVEKQEAQ